MSASRILIIGASGLLGQVMIRLLLAETNSELVLAGRDLDRVKAVAAKFTKPEYSSRISCIALNPEDRNSIEAAMKDVRFLLNATSRGAHNRILVEAACNAGADYMDAQLSNEFVKPDEELLKKVEQSQSCIVIQAGFHPGLPSALVRLAALKMDEVHRAIVGASINPEHGYRYTSGVNELVEMFGDYARNPSAYRAKSGKSKRPSKMEFAFGFGKRSLYPMMMPEMDALPQMIPGLEDTGLYISSSNWLTDYIMTPIIILGAVIAPKKLARPLGKLFCWSSRQFVKPPYGTVLQLDAEGASEGKPARLRVSLFHDDEYDLTAIPMIATMKQMLNGTAHKPGIHMMGHLCDPVMLIEDMEEMGIKIEQESVASAYLKTP